MGSRFPAWAVVFLRGPSFSCVGDRFHAWAFVFMRGRPVLCVGDRLRAWATVFMRGRPFLCMGDRLHAWRSFPCVGGWLDAEVVVGIGGVIVVRGVVVLWFSWNHSGRVGGACHVEEQRRTTNFHSSFGCHVTDSDVAPCSVCFACVLRLSWLCGARVSGCSVWRWMVRAGVGGRHVWMMGIRISREFPLVEIADILSRKEVTWLVLRA